MTRRPTTELSQRHELEIASWLPSGTQVTASGATLDRHDVRTLQDDPWQFRYELKATQQKSYSIKLQDHKELREYAIMRNERPAWALRFYANREVARMGDLPVEADLVVCEFSDWVQLLEGLRAVETNQQISPPL